MLNKVTNILYKDPLYSHVNVCQVAIVYVIKSAMKAGVSTSQPYRELLC